MFDCRIAALRCSELPPAMFPRRGFLPPSAQDGTASPLPVRGRSYLAARRRAACARVVIACPSFSSGGINSRRLHHAQDRFQHALEVGDLLLELLPPGRRQLVEAGAAVVLRLPPLRFDPAFDSLSFPRPLGAAFPA